MPVKSESSLDEQWLISHIPYDLGTSGLTEDIIQMISYNIRPIDEPFVVNYEIGKVRDGSWFRIIVRNLTQNATLRIGAKYNNVGLKLINDEGVPVEADNIILNRGETRSIRVFVDTEVFNSYSSTTPPIETEIDLVISHIANGQVIKRDPSVMPLEVTTVQLTNIT